MPNTLIDRNDVENVHPIEVKALPMESPAVQKTLEWETESAHRNVTELAPDIFANVKRDDRQNRTAKSDDQRGITKKESQFNTKKRSPMPRGPRK